MQTYNLLTGISDHNITLMSQKLTKKRFDSRAQKKRIYERITKNEIHFYENALQQIDWSNLLSSQDINSSDMSLSFTRKVKSKTRQK